MATGAVPLTNGTRIGDGQSGRARPPVQGSIHASAVARSSNGAGGKLLSDQTWYSSYRAEPKIVRVGPKKKKPVTTTTEKPATSPAIPVTATSTGGGPRRVDGVCVVS